MPKMTRDAIPDNSTSAAYQMALPGMAEKRLPFVNVSWKSPFLPALLDIALDISGNDLEKTCFIFPHARPALYLRELIKEEPRVAKPCILPHMLPVSKLFALARGAVETSRLTNAGLLDQVALLLTAVRELREKRGGLLRELPLEDSRRFFPWGVRLAKLMEELFIHDRLPEDYIHMQDQVTPFAAALLENLGALHERYVALLAERGWTTPGLDAFLVARSIQTDDFVPNLGALSGKHIILAGFHTLTGTQQKIFRHLWSDHGATVCLHADEAVVQGSPHWSCVPLVRWASAWRTKILPYTGHTAKNRPDISFHSGYDVHSQLSALAHELREHKQASPESPQAIVLPDTNLLLPVLHHLPDTDVNISMGYPLARSPLFRLIEIILTLQEKRRGSGPFSYHWKSLIDLLRHPYVKMLDPVACGETQPSLKQRFRRFLHHAERVVRSSNRFSQTNDIASRTAATYEEAEKAKPDESLKELFTKILETAVTLWEIIESPESLAFALQGLSDLMHDHGNALWNHFPIDAECLYRLTESVIPQLAHTALKEEPLSAPTLFAILRRLLNEERVPFEAYPLVGDQVMGVLETRLLHFDTVFVMDVTEDRLPGTQAHDPLVPDTLRPVMGLPASRGRETVAAYNFFRLISGAKHVSIYWQEGVEPQGLSDAKKRRSRFVEELLWHEEKQRGTILTPEKTGADGPLRLIACVLPPVTRQRAQIQVTENIRHRMHSLLQGDLSPSLLDAYLHCPAKFFYQRIGRINEVESVTEGRDPMGIGNFLHDVLRRHFADRLGKTITASEEAVASFKEFFLQELSASPLRQTLPFDDRIMLEEAGPLVLESMLKEHQGQVPLFIEEKFTAQVHLSDSAHTLAGIIDRVDEKDGALLVMDYKTGHVPGIANSVWLDEPFWESIENWHPEDGDAVFAGVAERFASVQLPAYVYMAHKHTGRFVHDAAYISLRVGGKATYLFGDEMDKADRENAITRSIPLLFSFLVRHMKTAVTFLPTPGPSCDWCLYKNLCIVAPRHD